MNLHASLNKIGKVCAEHTTVPFLKAVCCGMAWGQGFYYPELTASATRDLAAEINTKQYDGYYSSGKTCEIAAEQRHRATITSRCCICWTSAHS